MWINQGGSLDWPKTGLGVFLRWVFMHPDYGSFSLKRGRLLILQDHGSFNLKMGHLFFFFGNWYHGSLIIKGSFINFHK